MMATNVVFGDLLSEEDIDQILANSVVRPLEQGEVLCSQNMSSNAMYIILSGELAVSIESDNSTVPLAKRYQGELIGEIAALLDIPHIATVTASQHALALEVPIEVFLGLLNEHPELYETLLIRSKNRIIDTALRHVSHFREYKQQEFDELCHASRILAVNKGELITAEGDEDSSMYVICRGAVRVYTRINDMDVTVSLRRPGEFFGEFSYLTGQKRTASVSALTDVQLVKLEGKAPLPTLTNHEANTLTVDQVAEQRKTSLDQLREELDDKNIAIKRLNRIKSMIKYRL